MMSGLDFVGASDQDIAGAVKHLAGLEPQGRRHGLLHGRRAHHRGGGARRRRSPAACRSTACRRAELADPAKIKIPMQGHFANKDDWCTPEVVNEFEKKMAAGGNKPEIFRYDAQHAFANEKSPAYDAASAKASWERMMAFLGKHL